MSSPFFPEVPGGAFDRFVGDAERVSRTQRAWTPDDGPLPALYVGHGAPPLFDDGLWMDQLFRWSQALPKPRAILIVSAHWESAPLMLSASGARTPLVYDFGGFHPRYYAMTYPTPDAGDLARQVRALLPDREPVHEHPSRGLDHGAWVPLKVMYPLADVPVLQLSLPTQDPGRLLEIGQRLRPLREDGVLVIGSGFMTHGLPFMTREMVVDGAVPSWSADFDAWAADALSRGDVETLTRYQSLAPGLPYAHPTVDHYIPLFITLGAAQRPDQAVTTTIEGYMAGLSKRSFQVA
ncbi:MAG TPA: class III extradiol ring-cleavage dioxygenase [Streptosporangiaceae bacterium]